MSYFLISEFFEIYFMSMLCSSAHSIYLTAIPIKLTLSVQLVFDLHSVLNYHTPTRGLRSANTNLLSAPRVRATFASSGFSVAAPAV